MLSCIETALGFMVIGPKGQQLRVPRSHPAFSSGREILRQSMPEEQRWQLLTELMDNPLKALADWCERFGISFKDKGASLQLKDVTLSRERWLPLLTRTQASGASPAHLLEFAESLSGERSDAKVGAVSLYLRNDPLKGIQPTLLAQVGLPADARAGDIVVESSTGPVPFLVSYSDVLVTSDGTLQMLEGIVLSPIERADETQDILAQPAILGFNRTYRCEEGSSTGWLEDLSFDSLIAAQRNAKEIRDTGAEARIINRITGDPVALLS